ncbi:MAG: OsmC family peroxiredoxin [Chitinophagaceae bacterium]|nr:MAG: OsmC family peroxiredoxin [Chitinophagaceae bacterium]
MNRQHHYNIEVEWTGNTGTGTSGYTAFERTHTITGRNKVAIPGSSDPAFRGNPTRYNPEELLLASLSACHMLWYLHLCSEAGIVVTAYTDEATGTMIETDNGGGRFEKVLLAPRITLKDTGLTEKARQLHQEANGLCFIANSVNFPVLHEPVFNQQQPDF